MGWVFGNFWKIDPELQKIYCDQRWSSPLVKAPKSHSLPDVDWLGLQLPTKVWESRKPSWIEDIPRSSHFQEAPDALKEGLKSAIAFPIFLGEKMLGVMEFFSKEPKILDKDLLQTFSTIAVQVGQFILRKEVESRLQIAYEEMEKRVQERTSELLESNLALQSEIIERKKVEKEIVEITQKEQRRFGSQLHDGLCQDLAGILMVIKVLTKKLEREKPLDIADLKKVSDLLDGAVSQARDTARGLYPGELEGPSLMHMLEELVSTQNISGVSCRFHCPDPILISENDIATHFYKIAQEGISNAIKHGEAKSIQVSFIQNNGDMILSVKDEGIGFIDNPQNSKGIGLKIMKNRAHMMGATFQMEPNFPHGAILTCSLKRTP